MRNNNLINKISSVALAAAMAAGCALPVCAAEAKAGVTKDETVYVVLDQSGAVKSQSVSEHLHSDSGLSGVADVSNLQNIVNTQSDATFTQDGTTLHWNTEDTDVYYKGDSTDTPPITASISYQINGNHVSVADLPGQSGHLTINIALSNNTMDTVTIGEGENAKTRSVCTPFATVVGTMLSEDTFTNVSVQHGMVQSDGGSSIVGAVALPGVKACVNDLMPSQLDSLNDYLVDSITIEADVTDCTLPSIMIACAADASLLSSGNDDVLDKFDKIDDLQKDMDKLTDAMDQLTDGAKKLDDGVGDLRDGVKTLSDSTGTLRDGANTLKDGTTTLKNGTTTLRDGTTSLKDGTSTLLNGANTLDDGANQLYSGSVTLKDGTSQLRSGSTTLKDGTSQLRGGSITLRDGVNTLNTGLGTLTDGLNTLTSKNETLNNGAQQIADAVLGTANTQLKAAGAISEDMTWDNYASVLSEALGVNDEMRAQARAQLAQQVKEQTGAELTDEQLNCLIYMTAVAMGSDSNKDLNTAVAEAGAKMNQAASDAAGSIGAAQNALTDAGNNPLAVAEVNAVMENLAANTVLQQIMTTGGVDENTAKIVLLLAAQNSTGDLQADLNTQATALKSAQQAAVPVQSAQNVLAEAGNNPVTVPAVLAVLENSALQTIYGQINQGDNNAQLLTMAADAMAAGTETDLTTAVTAAGASATAALTAKGALESAGSPAAVPDVMTVLQMINSTDPTAAYTNLVAVLAAQGVTDETQAALIITMAAQNLVATGSTDVNGALAAAGASAKAVQTAQAELEAAGGNVMEGNVKTIIDANFVPTAYATIAEQVNAGSDENNALIITMGAIALADGTQTDLTTALQAAGDAAQAAKAAQDVMTAAQATLDAAQGNVLAVPEIKNVIDNGYTSQAYTTVAGQTGVTDEATNALLITMACQAMANGSQTDIAAALQSCGATLTNANDVQTAMATANSGAAEPASLMTAFLTKLVSTASADSLKQIEALNNSLAGVQGFVEGLKQYTAGVATAASGAASAKEGSTKLVEGANTLADGAAKVDDGAVTLVDGIGKADDGAGTLRDGLSTLYGATQNLVSGVQTLDSGATELNNGAVSLDDGAAKLDSGVTNLQSGATKLNDGAKTLYDGTGDLKNGTGDLVDGVNKLNDEGISKLTDGLDVDQLETLKAVATEMKNRQESYTSYAGAPEGVTANVKFVMKTSEANEKTTVATDSTTATTDTAVAETKPGLWKRFLALFGIGKD